MFGINDNKSDNNNPVPSGPPPVGAPPMGDGMAMPGYPQANPVSGPTMPIPTPDQSQMGYNPPMNAPTMPDMPSPVESGSIPSPVFPGPTDNTEPSAVPMPVPMPDQSGDSTTTSDTFSPTDTYSSTVTPEASDSEDTPKISSNYTSKPGTAPPPPENEDELLEIKKQALESLTPLVDELDQTPEERFKTTMMLIQASDNADLVKEAFSAANAISDEKARAQALLDVVNEINYFTQPHEN